MEFVIQSVKFNPYPVAFKEFRSSPSQDIGRDLYRRGRELQGYARMDVPKRTGRLAASIDVKYKKSLNPRVIVGSSLNYAYFVHEGTKPHIIRARQGRTLRFVQNGRVIYATKVNHPGTRPTRFLTKHLSRVVQ